MNAVFWWGNILESDHLECQNGDGTVQMNLKETDCDDVN
jgi:hypothetical protein